MEKKRIKEIVRQILFNPQVSLPPISYRITDKSNGNYVANYIDEGDFKSYLKRLEKRLVYRLQGE